MSATPPPAISCFMPCDLAPGLSFPYPSSRLMTPQIPRPAPRAMTKVCKTSTALLKKSIFYVPESFLYGFYDGNRKAGMSWPPCAAVDSGFSFQIFGCAFLRLCVSRVSAALSASSFTEWVSDLYIKIRQIRRILNLRPRPRHFVVPRGQPGRSECVLRVYLEPVHSHERGDHRC